MSKLKDWTIAGLTEALKSEEQNNMAKPTEITAGEFVKGPKGKYLSIKYVNKNGQEKDKRVYGDDAFAGFDGPGMYEIEWKQEGEYFNIKGMKKVTDTVAVQKPGGAVVKTQSIDKTRLLTDKSIISQVAIKAATDLAIAQINMKKDIGPAGPYVASTAREFMDVMRDFVASTGKGQKVEEVTDNESETYDG